MKTLTMTALTLLLLLLTPVHALGAGGSDYQPYLPGTDQISAPLFVIIAYAVIWLAVLGFVFSIFIRQRRVAAELAQVRQQLEDDGTSRS